MRLLPVDAKAGRGIALRIEIDDQHVFADGGKRRAEIDRGRGLADAALLIGEDEDRSGSQRARSGLSETWSAIKRRNCARAVYERRMPATIIRDAALVLRRRCVIVAKVTGTAQCRSIRRVSVFSLEKHTDGTLFQQTARA